MGGCCGACLFVSLETLGLVDWFKSVFLRKLLEVHVDEKALRNEARQLANRQVFLQVVALLNPALAAVRCGATRDSLPVIALSNEA